MLVLESSVVVVPFDLAKAAATRSFSTFCKPWTPAEAAAVASAVLIATIVAVTVVNVDVVVIVVVVAVMVVVGATPRQEIVKSKAHPLAQLPSWHVAQTRVYEATDTEKT